MVLAVCTCVRITHVARSTADVHLASGLPTAETQQLLTDYCYAQLLHAAKPNAFQITSDWFKGWQAE